MPNPSLPREILDHTVDLLHDDQDALKACCLVSESWVPRAREHLFTKIEFNLEKHLESWKKTFPAPSTSPAHYAKTLIIRCAAVVTVGDAEAGGWIRGFSRLVRLEMDSLGCYPPEPVTSLAPFHRFSHTAKSLLVHSAIIPPSQIFNFILSFPILEDLTVIRHGSSVYGDDDGSSYGPSTADQPSNPPAFTGTLGLSLSTGMGPIASKLLSVPGGIHFRSLTLTWHCEEDLLLATALVEECSHTLESLDITCDFVGMSIRYLRPHRQLTSVSRRFDVEVNFGRPLEGDETHGCNFPDQFAGCQMGHHNTPNHYTRTPRSPTNLDFCGRLLDQRHAWCACICRRQAKYWGSNSWVVGTRPPSGPTLGVTLDPSEDPMLYNVVIGGNYGRFGGVVVAKDNKGRDSRPGRRVVGGGFRPLTELCEGVAVVDSERRLCVTIDVHS